MTVNPLINWGIMDPLLLECDIAHEGVGNALSSYRHERIHPIYVSIVADICE